MSILRSRRPWLRAALLGCFTLATLSSARGAESAGPVERFTALADHLGDTGPTQQRTVDVEISIDRWSSDAERTALGAALGAHGDTGLLQALRASPRVGTFRSANSLAWDLHLAREQALPDGGRRIVLVTDRPISQWEANHTTPLTRYPFSAVELQLDKDGKGTGKVSVATKVRLSPDGQEIQLDSYSSEPVRLLGVKEAK